MNEPIARSDRRTLLWTVGSVVALALVIYGTAALSAPKKSDADKDRAAVEAPSDGASATSASLYEQALQAERTGDTTRAIELAHQATDADPGNTRALQLSVRLASAASVDNGDTQPPSPSPQPAATSAQQPAESGASSTETPSSEPVPTQPRVAKIASLLPVAAAGYWFGAVQEDPGNAVVAAEPEAGSAASGSIVRALFSVHDRKNDAAARGWVETMGKRVYAQGRTSISVAGSPGTFGTDGTRLAWCAYARGPYVFEVVVTASANPVAAKQATLTLAEAFRIKR